MLRRVVSQETFVFAETCLRLAVLMSVDSAVVTVPLGAVALLAATSTSAAVVVAVESFADAATSAAFQRLAVVVVAAIVLEPRRTVVKFVAVDDDLHSMPEESHPMHPKVTVAAA